MSILEATETVKFEDTAWHHAVRRVSNIAQEKMPVALHGHIQRATALVLDGGVFLDEDGHTCQVRSRDAATWFLSNGSCSCKDSQIHPDSYCKHRIARGIYLRASALLAEGGAQEDALVDAPEQKRAAEPVPSQIPPQHLTYINGKPFIKYAGLLAMAHERGLVELSAAWTYNDAELSLAHAVAIFENGDRFEESGDASPSNVHPKVLKHFRRMSLTRAKARCLRDALNIDVCSIEELGEEGLSHG